MVFPSVKLCIDSKLLCKISSKGIKRMQMLFFIIKVVRNNSEYVSE